MCKCLIGRLVKSTWPIPEAKYNLSDFLEEEIITEMFVKSVIFLEKSIRNEIIIKRKMERADRLGNSGRNYRWYCT